MQDCPMSFAIVTDSAADVESPIDKSEDLYFVPTSVIIDEKEFLDTEITNEELLQVFAAGKISTTSQPSPDLLLQYYQKAVANDLPVLGIHTSSKLSGIFNGAMLARRELEDHDIELFDGYSASFGTGYFVTMAVKLRDLGFSRDQVFTALQKARDHVHLEVLIDDIEYLKRGGRVNLGQYWFLKAFGLKPIIINQQGELNRVSFSFGVDSGVKKLIKRIHNYHDYGSRPVILVGHANSPDIIEKLLAGVIDIDCEATYRVKISATLLSHTGPGAFGIIIAPSLETLQSFIDA